MWLWVPSSKVPRALGVEGTSGGAPRRLSTPDRSELGIGKPRNSTAVTSLSPSPSPGCPRLSAVCLSNQPAAYERLRDEAPQGLGSDPPPHWQANKRVSPRLRASQRESHFPKHSPLTQNTSLPMGKGASKQAGRFDRQRDTGIREGGGKEAAAVLFLGLMDPEIRPVGRRKTPRCA